MKPIFNPSRLTELAKCDFAYWVKYIRNLDREPKVDPKRELGTFVHVAEAAVDYGGDPDDAMAKEEKKIRTTPFYSVKHSPALSQLRAEALKITEGGKWENLKGQVTKSESYKAWKSANGIRAGSLMDIEERYFVDVGPCILAPRFDAILVNDLGYWPYERKVTARWDDKTWENRWKLDLQTTLQVIAVRAKHKVPVPGVMLEPVQHSRQQSKDWNKPLVPQPIGKVQRIKLKWVRKPEEVIAQVMNWLENVSNEFQGRGRGFDGDWPTRGMFDGDWPTRGMGNRSCDYCSLRQLCLGDIPMRSLKPRKLDDIDKHNSRKKK